MNKTLKTKIINGIAYFVIFYVVFSITEAIIDLVMGWEIGRAHV